MPTNTLTAPGLRVLIAPDKFKGTLTSAHAATAIERGIRRAWPHARTTRLILTDGGEGFMELMVKQTGGRRHNLRTTDAIGRPCAGAWGELGNGRTAVVGLTNASGIAQVPVARRDPEQTTNEGTGRVLARLMARGFREILVGLGGSATTEGGISLAAAIGYQFLDGAGLPIPLNGAGLARLARIVPPASRLKARFTVATDVSNPLYGPRGAACQFAAQKGADSAMVARLDAGLRRLARIVKRDLGVDLAHTPGSGAAGGCGYGLMAFFGAKQENGFQLVRRLIGLDEIVRRHDLVITGEGSFDRTSLLGKGPAQLAELARSLGKSTWAFCGHAGLPLSRTPFVRLAALSTRSCPGPPLHALTCAQHAGRLEKLAYETTATASSKRLRP
jgi:glycerate kinase